MLRERTDFDEGPVVCHAKREDGRYANRFRVIHNQLEDLEPELGFPPRNRRKQRCRDWGIPHCRGELLVSTAWVCPARLGAKQRGRAPHALRAASDRDETNPLTAPGDATDRAPQRTRRSRRPAGAIWERRRG